MKTYEFTIVLANLDVMAKRTANDLYGAGCDDGTRHSGNGFAAVDFDREAPSLDEAIKSAIKDVEKAGLSVARVELGGEELAALRA